MGAFQGQEALLVLGGSLLLATPLAPSASPRRALPWDAARSGCHDVEIAEIHKGWKEYSRHFFLAVVILILFPFCMGVWLIYSAVFVLVYRHESVEPTRHLLLLKFFAHIGYFRVKNPPGDVG